MGNKNNINNKNNSTNQDKINKSFTLCPLINERKLISEKKIFSNTISSLTWGLGIGPKCNQLQ